MKKNRNLIKIFLTLVQIFVLGLPLFAFCFNAVAYRLGLKDLATSVSGNTESSIDESTFLNETNDINKFALQSIYDFNYISGIEHLEYNYSPLYTTNVVDYNDLNGLVDDLVVGRVYSLEYTSSRNGTYTIVDFNNFSVLNFDISYQYGTSTEYLRFYDSVNSNIAYDCFGFINNSSSNLDSYFYTRDVETLEDVYFRPTTANTLALVIVHIKVVFLVLENFTINIRQGTLSDSGFVVNECPLIDIPYSLNPTYITISDIPSFISATESMSYEDIVSNNYVNTHLLLNLDIVGLFTNNLNGNAYVYLWLNYFMNYLLTMSIVFICFDVIMYFILIVRKILDRSVEYSDRREF